MDRRLFCAGLLGATRLRGAPAVRVVPARPFPGSPVLFVREDEGTAEGSWLGRKVRFARDPEWKRWVALGAVGLNVKPGPQVLQLDGESVKVTVAPHFYRTGRLTVAPKFLEPPKKVRERIEEEKKLKARVFAERGERRWAGAFAAPTATVTTSPFGTKRTYNGKTQSVHQGLDFRAAVGTAVRASNAGRVVIAREMYFEGGMVAIDHGEGFFTLYMHLSKFLVKEGAAVGRGEEIGLSGATGRVTGPHLHFAAQWQGLYLDPGTLLGLKLG